MDVEVDFIQRKILQNYDHPHILDFCCGHGRHLLKLWQAGFQIDGLDINQDFLAHIEKESNHQVTTFLEDGRDFHPLERMMLCLIWKHRLSICQMRRT